MLVGVRPVCTGKWSIESVHVLRKSFARTHWHRENVDLRKQLLRILFRIGLIDEDELAQKISLSKLVIKPNSDLDKALRKALCCGWIDKVARRSKQKELEQYARISEIRGEI